MLLRNGNQQIVDLNLKNFNFFLIFKVVLVKFKTKSGFLLLPYVGYIGKCGPKGYGFLAVLI